MPRRREPVEVKPSVPPEGPRFYADSGYTFGRWKEGDDEPLIRATNPAVAQALARCQMYRNRDRLLGPQHLLRTHALHPKDCNWCAYPLEQVEEAIDYALWVSRYDRVSGSYLNPEWAKFYRGVEPLTSSLPDEEKRAASQRRFRAIEEAMYG